MTNNKQQTAVSWLEDRIKNQHLYPFASIDELSEQAKEMEKDRMMQFARYVLWKTVATMELTIEQHYEQTYGEDNYSENLEQWAWDNPCLSRSDVYNLFEEVFKTKRLTFDKTYAIGASKEVSDFQNKLRKLAKDKSELLQKSI
jgi:hypothetical protein